jgi:hypothetical protein
MLWVGSSLIRLRRSPRLVSVLMQLQDSGLGQCISVNAARRFTHPVDATLDRPPFRERQGGQAAIPSLLNHPLPTAKSLLTANY